MKMNSPFSIFVIAAVMLTGGGFGWLTGLAYYSDYWAVGMVAGLISGYPLAKFYLGHLTKKSQSDGDKFYIWLSGTCNAVLCGLICTAIVHGVMIAMIIMVSEKTLFQHTEGFWPLFVAVGMMFGTGAGLVVGGICTSIYVAIAKDPIREAA
ncbi:hypothetical protein STSP2_00944 [Anaerohalosphaera lusitana]|uniref:DUF4199 domain-containing protein n=1 Tax=Anaerohalosphaera lusitana TaxID=1936003 RepID=A0A1U9NIZ7_9BACT|nr:hypothetical protein [Anaerohalosphaera lusitana]AQT67795.1 hypothetical protein STSP2_00944 [Anaerohalosphaera lusitana]